MKHIKSFESTIETESTQPQIGDYVLMKTNQENIQEYISTHIGQISHIKYFIKSGEVSVKYENVPDDIINRRFFDSDNKEKNVRTFSIGLIIAFAPTIEELQQKLLKDKYKL